MAKWYWINPPTWVINMDIITDITQKNTRYGCHVGMTLDFKAPKVGICNFDVNDRNGTSSNCGFDASIASSFGQKSTERLSTEMEETYRVYRYLESTAFRKKKPGDFGNFSFRANTSNHGNQPANECHDFLQPRLWSGGRTNCTTSNKTNASNWPWLRKRKLICCL